MIFICFIYFICIYRISTVHFKQDDTIDNPVMVSFGEPSLKKYVCTHMLTNLITIHMCT